MSDNPPIDFGSFEKNASSTRTVFLELFPNIASFWEPGFQYESGDYVRPSVPTGFAYECTTAGQSALDEPNWPRVLAETEIDGSAIWTARAAGSNAINAVSGPTATVDPTGELAVTPQALVNGTGTDSRLPLQLAGGVVGTEYTVSVQFTASGQTLVAVFSVHVK